MANIRYQKPKLKGDIDTLFTLYTQNAVIDTKTLKTAFGVSPNTALRAIRLCKTEAQKNGIVFYTQDNEVPTKHFFDFYGWDIDQIAKAHKMT